MISLKHLSGRIGVSQVVVVVDWNTCPGNCWDVWEYGPGNSSTALLTILHQEMQWTMSKHDFANSATIRFDNSRHEAANFHFQHPMPHHWPRSIQGVDFTVGPDFSWCLASNWHGRSCSWRLPSLKLTARPWKPMVGTWIFLLARPIFRSYVTLLIFIMHITSTIIFYPTYQQASDQWLGWIRLMSYRGAPNTNVKISTILACQVTWSYEMNGDACPSYIWVKESTSYPNNKTTWICTYNKISIYLTYLCLTSIYCSFVMNT